MGARAISLGSQYGCAVQAGNTIQCWGRIPVPTVSGVASLATGSIHMCAVKITDEILCWGGNQFGQLGDGTILDVSQRKDPVTVELPPL
jgi:alpha-tubulin suppressor-like RCC1 family protein